MKHFTYAFHADFPARYLPLAESAFAKACEWWEESGVVKFKHVPKSYGSDIVIEWGPLPAQMCKEDGENRKPTMVTFRSDGGIRVNSLLSWQTSKWQFWRLIWEPETFAHELHHILLDTSWHDPREWSVGHYRHHGRPDLRDFRKLAAHIAAHEHIIG